MLRSRIFSYKFGLIHTGYLLYMTRKTLTDLYDVCLSSNSSSSCLHDGVTVRSGAGTLQVPAGALATVMSGAEISLQSLRASVSHGAS